MDWGKQAIQPTNLHNRIKYWSNSLQIDQQMNFLSSTEQVSAQKPVAVSEIFSHLDADNAVSGTLSLYECDFDNNHVFQMDEILFCGQWVILGATIFLCARKKGFLGCWVASMKGKRYFLWLFSRAYSRMTSFPAAMEEAHESCLWFVHFHKTNFHSRLRGWSCASKDSVCKMIFAFKVSEVFEYPGLVTFVLYRTFQLKLVRQAN